MDFMRQALKDVPDQEPEMPPDRVVERIDPRTGTRATRATEGAISEVFRAENAPGAAAANLDGNGRGYAPPPVAPPPTQDLF